MAVFAFADSCKYGLTAIRFYGFTGLRCWVLGMRSQSEAASLGDGRGVAGSMHDTNDDQVRSGRSAVNRVRASECDAEVLCQLRPDRRRLRKAQQTRTCRGDAVEQARRNGLRGIGRDVVPEVVEIDLRSGGQSEFKCRAADRSLPRLAMSATSKSTTQPAAISSSPS